MIVRLSCRSLLSNHWNLALLSCLMAAACGEARYDIDAQGIRGTLRMRIATYPDQHSETFYRLVANNDETLELAFAKNPPRVAPGTEIVVRGAREGSRLRVDEFDVVSSEIGEQALALDATPDKRSLKLAMLVVDGSYSTTRARQRLFQAVDSPAAFYKDNSYGDWTIEGDVFGPYNINIPGCADSQVNTIASNAKAAAQAAGVDLGQYDNLMYYLPASAGCAWLGLAEVGTNPVAGFRNGKDTWYRGDGCVVLVQELAHNLGLLHSHTCTAPPYASTDYGNAQCSGFREYGDAYTPMGAGCGHFNAMESGSLALISGCNTVAVTSSGSFEIGPIETRCTGPQVLRVRGAANVNQGPQYIHAEYRKGKGTLASDTKSLAGVYLHASAVYGGNLTDTVDPDNRYAVDPFLIHAPLSAGQEWTEPSSGVTFRVVSMGGTATVQLTFAGGGTGAPKCADGSTPPSAPTCSGGPVTGNDGGVADSGRVDAARVDSGRDAGGSAGAGTSDGGDPGAGGTSIEAGSNGAGGTTGGGGSSVGTAGATLAGAGGKSTANDSAGSAGQESGCGCRMPGAAPQPRTHALLLAIGGLIFVTRRGLRPACVFVTRRGLRPACVFVTRRGLRPACVARSRRRRTAAA